MKLSRHSAQKSSLIIRFAAQLISMYSQLLSVVLLLLLGKTVLSLGDFELALSHQGDETDTQVGSSEIQGEELSLLLSSGPLSSAALQP